MSRVLLSNKVNYWTGEECRNFEKEFALWCGVKYAVSLANGTVALDAALRAIDIKPGDEVIVTPRTFVASVFAIVNVGAIPVFADVERESGNISAKTIAAVLTPRVKAVICVHLGGMPCDMDPIMELSKQHNFKVIEDCAQAHGALYKGRSVGSIGHIGAWSFCQDKIITTGGEGGMITTNSEAYWHIVWSYKDHGKSYLAVKNTSSAKGFKWVHESFGTNFRMLEMQAAIGRIQLTKIRDWTEKRNINAMRLSKAFQPFSSLEGSIRLPQLRYEPFGHSNQSQLANGFIHAQYKFYAHVRPKNLALGWTRDRIIESFNDRGIPCYFGSCSEVYLEKAFDGKSWRPKFRLPIAKELGETSLAFLVHPSLTDQEIHKTCDVISLIMTMASK